MSIINGTHLMTVAFQMFKRDNEEARQKFYSNMSAFYFRIKNEMEKVIKTEFYRKPFSQKTLEGMYFFHDDVIAKIIGRKTAGIFTQMPVVYIDSEQDQELSDFLYEINFFETVKEVYKRSKYFNTILLHPVYDSETEQLRLDILQGDNCAVVNKKDYLQIDEIIIARVNEKQEIYYSYWNEQEHYIIDGAGNEMPTDGNEDKVNPFYKAYQQMPFSIYRDKIGWDFWGEPNIALYTFQMLHTLKVSDNERGEFYYKFPIGYSLNFPIDSGDEISPGFIKRIENNNPNAQVKLEFVNTETDWGEIRENESSRRESFLVNQGLPASSASIDIKALSGSAKTIDELELVESKEEDKENLLRFVYDALDKVLMVAETYKVIKKKYNRDTITVELQQVPQYESEQDKWLRREKELQLGMKDIIDFIMEDEGCTEEEAIEKLTAIRERREKIEVKDITKQPKPEPTLQDLFAGPTNGEAL